MITALQVTLAHIDGQPLFCLQPIARGTIEDTGYHPWLILYRSSHEQSVIDHQRRGLHRATNRILTLPLDELADLPLLSNPGRTQLSTGPWEEPKKHTTRARKAAVK